MYSGGSLRYFTGSYINYKGGYNDDSPHKFGHSLNAFSVRTVALCTGVNVIEKLCDADFPFLSVLCFSEWDRQALCSEKHE